VTAAVPPPPHAPPNGPGVSPTDRSTDQPTNRPTDRPTGRPTNQPTNQPTIQPSNPHDDHDKFPLALTPDEIISGLSSSRPPQPAQPPPAATLLTRPRSQFPGSDFGQRPPTTDHRPRPRSRTRLTHVSLLNKDVVRDLDATLKRHHRCPVSDV
jgi:hypothetical protein